MPAPGDRRCGGECGGRGREREEEGVALGIDLDPSLGGAGGADQSAMLRERFDVSVLAELAQEPRRALDISEEERDGAGRDVLAHDVIICRAVARVQSSSSSG